MVNNGLLRVVTQLSVDKEGAYCEASGDYTYQSTEQHKDGCYYVALKIIEAYWPTGAIVCWVWNCDSIHGNIQA